MKIMKTMPRSLPLTPRLSDSERAFIEHPALALQLLSAFGSPLNVVFPREVRSNYRRFNALLNDLEIDGALLYAQKANKSHALLRELIFAGAGTNNASLAELQQALANGCPAERAEAGGPKTEDYLTLACFAGALINVDSLSELQALEAIAARLQRTARVLLRLSGFRSQGVQILSKPTRFGIHIDDVHKALELIAASAQCFSFEGLSYHLDTVAIAEKSVALDGLVRVTLAAAEHGLRVRLLDIGGGFKVNYLQSQLEWESYMTALREALLGKSAPLTWQGAGFGLREERGVISGNLNMYSYYDNPVQEHYLRELLEQPSSETGSTFAEFFRETRVQLLLEPGRALLAGAGMTLARVIEVSSSSEGDVLVRLDMNRADITIQDLELFVDPVLLPAASLAKRPALEDGCYLIGNLCLESDFVSRRKVFLPSMPAAGDVLAFANSAGYIMDFNAHRAALQRIAEKVAVFQDATGEWRWTRDEIYWPGATT
jgi:diaminopimelate decarboxylase